MKPSLFFNIVFFSFLSFAEAQTISFDAFWEELQKVETSEKDTSFTPSFFTEISVRSQTKDFDLEKQAYALRFSTSNRKTRDYQKQYIQLLEDHDESSEFKTNKVQLGYLTWMTIYITQKEQVILQDLLATLTTEKKLFTSLVGDNTRYLNDLIKSKEAILETELKRELNEKECETHEKTLLLLLERKEGIFDYNSFENQFSIESLKTKLHEDPSFFIEQDPKLNELAFKEQLLDISHNLEKQKNRKIIDFFQIEASDLDTPEFRKNVSLGIGLLIPRNKSLKETELLIEKEKLALFKNQYHQMVENEQSIIQLKIQHLLEKYSLSEENLTLLEQHANLPKSNVEQLLIFLEAKKTLLEKRLDLLTLEKEIFEAYVDVLK